MFLVEYSTRYNCVQVMLSTLRMFDFASDNLMYAIAYENSCSRCYGSRSMVPVYSDEGIDIIVENDINFPIEDVTIEVSIPQ